MLSRFSIRTRLQLVLASVAIVSTGITAGMSYRIAREAIEEQSFERLTAVREMKGSQVEDYLHQIVDQALTLSESRIVTPIVSTPDSAALRSIP